MIAYLTTGELVRAAAAGKALERKRPGSATCWQLTNVEDDGINTGQYTYKLAEPPAVVPERPTEATADLSAEEVEVIQNARKVFRCEKKNEKPDIIKTVIIELAGGLIAAVHADSAALRAVVVDWDVDESDRGDPCVVCTSDNITYAAVSEFVVESFSSLRNTVLTQILNVAREKHRITAIPGLPSETTLEVKIRYDQVQYREDYLRVVIDSALANYASNASIVCND